MVLMMVLWVVVGFSLVFVLDVFGGFVGGFDYVMFNGVGFDVWDGMVIFG